MSTSWLDDGQEWINDPGGDGPSLEDFLGRGVSDLPFLQGYDEVPGTSMEYRLFADEWCSIENLKQVRETVLNFVQDLARGYIWHHDSFSLSVVVSENEEMEPHMYGCLVFGDNTSDEWFVCFLLYQVSRQFPWLTVSMVDTDGQFLLIETTAAIPKFLTPTNSDNRVWLRSGQVHLVMPGAIVDREKTPRALGSGKITCSEGLKAVREGDDHTIADESVQRLIQRKIEGYPEKVQNEMHQVRCFLPITVALVLRIFPGFVSPAAHAFCSGDPMDRKRGALMRRLFSLSDEKSIHVDGHCMQKEVTHCMPMFVEQRVIFTRHLYAMIAQAPMAPPSKVFPQGWGPGSAMRLSVASREKASAIGQKLSVGLEAAYQTSAEQCAKRANGDIVASVGSRNWRRYLSGLERAGFFEGEMEGSKLYKEKIAMAEEFLQDRVVHLTRQSDGELKSDDAMYQKCSMHEKIDHLLKQVDRPQEFLPVLEDDDEEEWRKVSPEDLERMLRNYDGLEKVPRIGASGNQAEETTEENFGDFGDEGLPEVQLPGEDGNQEGDVGDGLDQLDDIVVGMNTFVSDTRAGPEGVEMEDAGGEIQFDVDKFMQLLRGEDLRSALEKGADEAVGVLGSDRDQLDYSSQKSISEADELTENSNKRMPELGVPVHHKAEWIARDTQPSSAGGAENKEIVDGVCEVEGTDSDDELETAGLEQAQAQTGEDEREKLNLEHGDSVLQGYMAAMDVELQPSTMGESFEKMGNDISQEEISALESVGPLDQTKPFTDQDSAVNSTADFRPVDVDLNLVKHLLESTVSQGGLSGPASNLLRSMGLSFPSIPTGSSMGGGTDDSAKALGEMTKEGADLGPAKGTGNICNSKAK